MEWLLTSHVRQSLGSLAGGVQEEAHHSSAQHNLSLVALASLKRLQVECLKLLPQEGVLTHW